MKKELAIPLLSLVGGVFALLLRFWQNQTGFDFHTGLPLRGAPAGMILIALLAALALVLLLLCLRLPKEADPGPAIPGDFSYPSVPLTTLQIAGSLMFLLSGLADLLEGLGFGNLLFLLRASADPYGAVPMEDAVLFPQKAQLLLGVLALLSGAAVFLAAASCRVRSPLKGAPLLLVPPVALVIRLVVAYRVNSINPVLEAYYVDLLALAFLTMAFYRLSSFAFQAGRTRRFAFYASLAVILSLASLADGGSHLSSSLLYMGGTMSLLGFLTVRLLSPAVPIPAIREEIGDSDPETPEAGGDGEAPA